MKVCYNNIFDSPAPQLESFTSSTLTTPNLAPSLIELLNASVCNNEPLPDNGLNIYDDSDEAGLARLASSKMSVHEVFEAAEAGDEHEPLHSSGEEPTSAEKTTSENEPSEA